MAGCSQVPERLAINVQRELVFNKRDHGEGDFLRDFERHQQKIARLHRPLVGLVHKHLAAIFFLKVSRAANMIEMAMGAKHLMRMQTVLIELRVDRRAVQAGINKDAATRHVSFAKISIRQKLAAANAPDCPAAPVTHNTGHGQFTPPRKTVCAVM